METSRPQQLNPPHTPLCPEYNNLYATWAGTPEALKDNRIVALGAVIDHRASCPQCRKRMLEINEEAKVAKEPEVKDE